MRQKPTVLASEIVAKSRLFAVEELQLRFSNGVERTYERLVGKGQGYGAVMVVAMLDAEHAVLVEEYCAGVDEYQLSLPKGLVEPGEDILAAANRELKEEAGYGARQLEHITELSLSPGYMSQRIQVVLARDLYEERLPGDEPEPMGVDRISLRELSSLAQHAQFSEGRALAALYLVRGVVIVLFLWLPLSVYSAYAFGVAMGLLWLSTVPLTNGTVATLFGVRNLSMLGGIVFLFHQLGAFLGGWLGGVVYDRTGSYDLVWQLSILLSLLAALLNWPVRERPVARLQVAGGAA